MLKCLLLLYLSYSLCRDMTDAARILKTTMKCHLKQNEHSFIPYYAYIIVINIMCHGEMQTNSPIPPPSQ